MAFAHGRRRDAQELGLSEFGERAARRHSPCRAQAADQLVQHAADRSLVGHLALDAFRHELQGVLDLLLEVAVGRAARHGADRAHAAVGFVGAALVEIDLARASSVPASSEPIITQSAPAASALTRSPEIFDAAVGDDRNAGLAASSAQSMMAVSCGTPTPATMRVVQIEPGPMPTLTASAPASISALVPSAVATLPAMTCTRFESFLMRRHRLEHAARVAVRGIDDDEVARRRRSAARCARSRPRRPSSPRRRAAGRAHPWRRAGCFCAFSMSLTVIRPMQR